jgi:general nucleoside transport system permease protein
MSTIAARLPDGRRSLAGVGVAVGIVAALLMVPPITLRTPIVPVVLGLVAVTIGIGSWIRGERRIGGYAVGAGVIGLAIGVLATRSSVENLDAVVVWGALIGATLRYATPLLFAALGGLFSERSGVVNIGLEGMMLTGAFFAIWGADVTDTWTLGLAIGIGSGALFGLLHAFFSITLRADQIVGGTAINLIALGLTTYLFIKIYGTQGTPTGISSIPNVTIGFLDGIPVIGNFLDDVFGRLNVMIWAGFLLVVAVWVIVFKTPIGLRIRSVGEHPRAADTVGINVYAVRYGAVILSGALAAAGGAYLSLGFVETFDQNMTAGRGFIALAALIFGSWRPFGAAAACLLFGFSSALSDNLQTYSTSISVLFEALPYALTLVAVAGVIGRSIPPAAIGRPYVKQ